MKKLLLCLFLLGCNESQREQVAPTPSQEAQHVTYLKDNRTNLCFATSYVSEYPFGTATIFANVPCTPEVEKLIK
jgi:hypothetical protein